MPSIVVYQKIITAITTTQLVLPYDGMQPLGQEIATVGNDTYVTLFDGAVLPTQPIGINPVTVTLTDELKAAIQTASPHVALINCRVVEHIRVEYTMDDELKLLRLGPSVAFTTYNTFVEECRTWGRAEKAKLGL